jgi:acyl-CoA thioester hydrolase
MIKPEYAPELFPHWTRLPVRFRDLDPLNHVNNAVFSTYFEEARIRFIQQVPALVEEMNSGYSFVLASLRIDYIRPVEYPATLIVGSGIKQLGNSSITSFQAIYTEERGKPAAVAEVAGVWYDVAAKKPARLPELPDKSGYMIDQQLFHED